MDPWVWWLIWGVLALFAVGIWGYLLYSYTPSVKRIFESLKKLEDVALKLDSAASAKTKLAHPKDNLSDSLESVQMERKGLLDQRRKRKEARTRSLIARVKNIKLEGRFKDVR